MNNCVGRVQDPTAIFLLIPLLRNLALRGDRTKRRSCRADGVLNMWCSEQLAVACAASHSHLPANPALAGPGTLGWSNNAEIVQGGRGAEYVVL